MLTFGNRRPVRVTNIVIPSKNSSQRWRKNNFRFLVSYRDTTSLNSNRSHSTATGTIVGGGDSPISAPLRQTRQQIEARKVSTFRHRPLVLRCFSIEKRGRSQRLEVAQRSKRTHAECVCCAVCARRVTLKYSSVGYVWLILYESMAVRGRRFSISRLAFVTWAAITVDTYYPNYAEFFVELKRNVRKHLDIESLSNFELL